MGCFCGLVVKRGDFHADLKKNFTQIKNKKETKIYNKSPPRNSAGQALPPFKGESHLLAHLK